MNISPVQRPIEAADIAPEKLANNSQLTEEQKVSEAARQFEALLLRQILENTQKPVIRSSFSDDSTSSSIYRDLVTNQLADSISKSGALGLAKTLETQFQRATHAELAAAQKLNAEAPVKTETGEPLAKSPSHQLPARLPAWPHMPKEQSL